jgi:hypothetical protein
MRRPKMRKPVQDGKKNFGLMMELADLAERAFVHKLKRKNPQVTPVETEAAVRAWYQHRPGSPVGDGDGVSGDIRRFIECDNSKT